MVVRPPKRARTINVSELIALAHGPKALSLILTGVAEKVGGASPAKISIN
jgi:hypothetical protein